MLPQTNGFSLIMHHRRLNLSPTMPLEALQVAWAQLKAQAKTWDPVRPLPEDLAWQSPPQVAMLAYLCQEWRYSRTAVTAAELVEQTMTQKLIPEVGPTSYSNRESANVGASCEGVNSLRTGRSSQTTVHHQRVVVAVRHP